VSIDPAEAYAYSPWGTRSGRLVGWRDLVIDASKVTHIQKSVGDWTLFMQGGDRISVPREVGRIVLRAWLQEDSKEDPGVY